MKDMKMAKAETPYEDDIEMARDLRRVRNTIDKVLARLNIPDEELVVGRPLRRNNNEAKRAAAKVVEAEPLRKSTKPVYHVYDGKGK